jgi:hypothetical protein
MAKRKPNPGNPVPALTLMKTAFCDGFMAARDLVTLGKATSDENMNKMCEFYLKRIIDKLDERGAKL